MSPNRGKNRDTERQGDTVETMGFCVFMDVSIKGGK